MSIYENLCEAAHITPLSQPLLLQQFNNLNTMAERSSSERLTAALQVFLNLILEEENPVERIDKILLDQFIGRIDQLIYEQLDIILHDANFQQLESLWTSLKYLVDRTDFRANTKIEILDIS
jgi:type VI secretion system protein ImpC